MEDVLEIERPFYQVSGGSSIAVGPSSRSVRTRAKGWCKVEKGSSEFASLHEMPLERNRHLAINYSKIRQT